MTRLMFFWTLCKIFTVLLTEYFPSSPRNTPSVFLFFFFSYLDYIDSDSDEDEDEDIMSNFEYLSNVAKSGEQTAIIE